MAHPITNLPAVIVPPEDDLGPAMLALTVPQRAFVTALMLNGGRDATAAAELAGYAGTDNSRRVRAHYLMRNPRVLAALREEADRRLRSGVALASSVMIEIAMDVNHKDRFKAADRLMERAGMIVEQTHRVVHEDNRTNPEIRAALLALAKANNLDIKTLGITEEPIDAEFAEGSSEGLEDLLA